MKIRSLSILLASAIIPIATPLVFVSCSSSVDQKYVDKFYNNIIEKKDWSGNQNEYASAIYNLETFRAIFRDQLPTDSELKSEGFTMSLENIIPYDNLGISNYTVYLRDFKNGKTYLPTPKKIDENSDIKEPIISFSINNFLKSTSIISEEFNEAYKLVEDKYELSPAGKNFFETQNIETNISFDNLDSPYYVAKLFNFKPIPNFEIGGFEEVRVSDKTKSASFRLFLKRDGNTKGPGKVVTISLPRSL
ncbi:MAG: hypothetical protein ACRC7B_00670 [Metamycoplasmataceae bacterium]